jgi:hypothetical protein
MGGGIDDGPKLLYNGKETNTVFTFCIQRMSLALSLLVSKSSLQLLDESGSTTSWAYLYSFSAHASVLLGPTTVSCIVCSLPYLPAARMALELAVDARRSWHKEQYGSAIARLAPRALWVLKKRR